MHPYTPRESPGEVSLWQVVLLCLVLGAAAAGVVISFLLATKAILGR